MTISRRKPAVAFMALALTVGLAITGCSSSSSTPRASGSSDVTGMKVTLLTVSQSCAYCATHTDELKADAQKAGVDLTVVVNEFDAGVQAQQVNQVISTKPDVVILWAADATAILPSLARLKSAKIPVVLTNTHPQTDDTSLWTAYTGPDDTDYGRKAGEAMITALKAKGQTSGSVVVVTGVPGTPGAINRLKGFTETLEKDAPQITIAGTQNADWDQTKGTTAAAALLSLYGKDDLVGIYAEADNMLAGAIVAADRAGYKPGDLTMVGSNCSIEGYTNIESGAQQASVLLSPYDDASLAWQATLKVLQGDDVANETFIPPVVITNSNLADCAAAVDK